MEQLKALQEKYNVTSLGDANYEEYNEQLTEIMNRTDETTLNNVKDDLIDLKHASDLFDDEWPIYTRTNDSCPTQYFEGSKVTSSVVSNGCLIEGTIENSIIGRGCTIKKGAVVKNSIILPTAVIGEDVHIENHVVDKHANIIHAKNLTADPDYFRRMLFHGYHDKARSPTEDADNEPDGKRTSEHLATPHLCKDMTSPPILTRILRDLNEERP